MKRDLNKILSYTVQEKDCLVWTRCFNTDGYPRAAIDGHFNGKVHRIVYELVTGEDITGLVVRHTCDNPRCINPDHLLKGTPIDNVNDRDSRQRNGWAKITHDEVRAIRELYKTGKFTQAKLGNMFNLSPSTISSLVRGRHWRHVV